MSSRHGDNVWYPVDMVTVFGIQTDTILAWCPVDMVTVFLMSSRHGDTQIVFGIQ